MTATYANGSATYNYSYDDNGNIVSISSGGSTITYTYDSLNQLTRENNPITNRTTLFSYDTAGNITSKRVYTYTLSLPRLPLETIFYGYNTTDCKDRLISYNGNTIEYDNYGNPTTYGNYGFTWTGKELTGVMSLSPSVLVSSYTYNDNGLRTTKKTLTSKNTTKYTWDGRLLIGQSNGTTTLTFSYDANGNVVSMFNGISRYYYQRNGQNDIVGILNSSGTQVVAYTYDVWGKLISVTGTLAGTIGAQNPFRYRGYYYDNETGFYYLQSRYYDPTTGRFISPDVLVSTGQGILGHNMYAYCGNNPVNRADDEGEFWHIVVGAVGGAIINGIIQIVSNVTSGEEWSSGLASSMLTGAASGALAASGAGLAVSIAGNAAISMAGNFANQVVENKGFNDFDVGDMLIDGVVGGIAGGIGGRGMGKAVNLKTLNSRLTKKMLSGSSKIALKGVKY